MDRRARKGILEDLRRDGARIAERFGLRYQSIEAEGASVKRRYGSCARDGRIWIRLRHARTGEPLKYSSMIDTLCHELAHLRYFHHGPAFRAFYFYLLDWARAAKIYRPSPRGQSAAQAAAAGQFTVPASVLQSDSVAAVARPVSAARRRARRRRPQNSPEQLQLF